MDDHALRSELRRAIGPLTLQLPSKDVIGLGTCFIVGAMGTCAIAITAWHCVEEASKHDVPNRVQSAPGSPFQIERSGDTWNRIELGTVLHHRDLPFFMSLPVEVEEAYWNRQTDVAFLLLRPDEEYKGLDLDKAIDLFSDGPNVGERVLVVGFFETEVRADHHRERVTVARLLSTFLASFKL